MPKITKTKRNADKFRVALKRAVKAFDKKAKVSHYESEVLNVYELDIIPWTELGDRCRISVIFAQGPMMIVQGPMMITYDVILYINDEGINFDFQDQNSAISKVLELLRAVTGGTD